MCYTEKKGTEEVFFGVSEAKKGKKTGEKQATNCESCVFYDYDEEYEAYVCTQDLDEDEMIRFLEGGNRACPYYRYYDEYKSVHKQI